MEILGKLFGTQNRVKIMRLFLLNPETGYDTATISNHIRANKSLVRKELNLLSSAGFIKAKKVDTKDSNRKVSGFVLATDFHYIKEMKRLLVDAEFLTQDEIAKRFKKAGRIKLLVISGVFLKDDASRIDFMLVGDNFKKSVLDRTIRTLEAEIGKELSYSVFDTEEFKYRLSMYDKLIRDVLDYNHKKVIDTGSFVTTEPVHTGIKITHEPLSTRK